MMKVLRSSLAFLCLALAVVLGQQAVLLHDLGHAIEKQQGVPDKTCDTHGLCAQLGSAVGGSAPVVAIDTVASSFISVRLLEGASQRARLAYRSQAPPKASRAA